jgi:hypothetical protein
MPPDTAIQLDAVLPACDILVDRVRDRPVPLPVRQAIMFHYDDSSSDAAGVSWFRSPQFKLSYNRAYQDDGRRVRITRSMNDKADHAGVCRVKPGVPVHTLPGTSFRYGGANTAYWGLCAMADGNDTITMEQCNAMVEDAAILYRAAGWSLDELDTRIIGHDQEAIFNPRDNPTRRTLWGKIGRKSDPTGAFKQRPVVDLDRIREGIAAAINDPSSRVWARWPG